MTAQMKNAEIAELGRYIERWKENAELKPKRKAKGEELQPKLHRR